MTTYEKAKRELEGILRERANYPLAHPIQEVINQILNLTFTDEGKTYKVGVYEVDVELPILKEDIHIWRDYSPGMAYDRSQQDMLNAGWVKKVEDK